MAVLYTLMARTLHFFHPQTVANQTPWKVQLFQHHPPLLVAMPRTRVLPGMTVLMETKAGSVRRMVLGLVWHHHVT